MTDLSFGEVERDGDLVSPQSGQVVVVVELVLELPDLLLGERRPLLARLRRQVQLFVAALLARDVTCMVGVEKEWKKSVKECTFQSSSQITMFIK